MKEEENRGGAWDNKEKVLRPTQMEMEQFHFRKSMALKAQEGPGEEEKKLAEEEEAKKGPGRVTLMAGYKKDRGTYNPDEDGGIAEGDEEASGSGSGSGSPSSVKGGAAESPQQQSSLALVAVGSGAAGVVGLSRMKVQKR